MRILSTKCEKSCFEILHGVYPRGGEILRCTQDDRRRRVQDDNLLSYKFLQQIAYKNAGLEFFKKPSFAICMKLPGHL